MKQDKNIKNGVLVLGKDKIMIICIQYVFRHCKIQGKCHQKTVRVNNSLAHLLDTHCIGFLLLL